jgi:hypothetical protein
MVLKKGRGGGGTKASLFLDFQKMLTAFSTATVSSYTRFYVGRTEGVGKTVSL